jgi:uncharacterized protein YecE (DUF72 family)
MGNSGEIHVGTSGWHYEHWKGPFYPEHLPNRDFLSHYTRHFQTVEINNSFYQLPEKETLLQWRETAPSDFTFAVKANRYITHMKKLRDPKEPVSNLMEQIDLLEDKLGPILFQLPPNWKVDPDRLQCFLETLPGGYRYAFELRDPSWLEPTVYELLSVHNVALCIYDFKGRLSPKKVTADFVYVRLHGPVDAYQGKYDTQTLAGWAGAFSYWTQQITDIYCYFDNDQVGYAVENALELQDMIS